MRPSTAERVIPQARHALAARLLDESVFAEAAHIALAAFVWWLFHRTALRAPLNAWVVIIAVAAITRALVRRRAARASTPHKSVPLSVRAAIAATGLVWGLGFAYLVPHIPLVLLALLMVVLCGLTAAATSTLIADQLSYYLFITGVLVPLAVGLYFLGNTDEHRSFSLLVLLYAATLIGTYQRAHKVFRTSVTNEFVLAESRSATLAERKFLDRLVSSVPNAVAVLDNREYVLRVNPAFEAMFGFTSDEVVGNPLNQSIVPPEGRDQATALWHRVLRDGTLTHEAERRRKDGHRLFVRISAARVDAEAGTTLVLYDDVSERRARERRAAAETAVIHALSEAKTDQDLIPVVLIAVGHHLGWSVASYWRIETGGTAARCSLTWAEDRHTRDDLFRTLRGTTVGPGETAIGRAWSEHSETWIADLAADATALPEGFGALRDRGSVVAVPVNRGWDTVGVLAFTSPEPRPRDASILETIAIIATQLGNTMDRIRAEAALREAETQYRQLVEAATDVVWRVNKAGVFTFVNEASRRVWGWAPNKIVGQPFSVLAHPESAEVMRLGFERLMAGEELRNYETVQVNIGGDAIHVSVSASPLHDTEGSVVGAQGIVRDIGYEVAIRDANERAREAAEQAAAAKSAFLANMSHEIRTPMTGVLGLADLVLAGDLTADQRRSVELIIASGESLLRIINDILDLSKIEAHQLDLELTTCDLTEITGAQAALLAPAARQRGVELVVDVDPRVPRFVRGDPVRLGQILTNLIGNAIKFTARGQVVLTVRPDPEHGPQAFRFGVRDTGMGIDANAIAKIFEPFRQADVSTTRMFGGTGLGLSIARRLVELMGGELRVESEVGVGSDFHFTIHLAAAEALPASRRTDPTGLRAITDGKPPARVLRVLIAEDNPVNQEVAATMLRRRGHSVDIANNGREAVDAVRRAHYDVVLMDLQMPQLDGTQATQEIRGAEARSGVDRPVTIIALTANALRGERERCLAAGMDGYLSKPFRPAELINAVEGDVAHVPTVRAAQHFTPPIGVGVAVHIEELRAELLASGVGDAFDAILSMFLADAPNRWTAIEEAAASHDAHEIVRAAHAYKSSAGTVRARELASALQRLEDAARAGDRAAITAAIAATGVQHEAVIAQLTERTSIQ